MTTKVGIMVMEQTSDCFLCIIKTNHLVYELRDANANNTNLLSYFKHAMRLKTMELVSK